MFAHNLFFFDILNNSRASRIHGRPKKAHHSNTESERPNARESPATTKTERQALPKMGKTRERVFVTSKHVFE